MSQTTSKQHDPDMLDEYDFSKGVRGKYAKLNLKLRHKAIRDYYTTLQQYAQQGIKHEGAVSSPMACREDEALERQDAVEIQRFPHDRGHPSGGL